MKYFLNYIDIFLFIILLIFDFKDIIAYINGSQEFNIFDLLFNFWFLLLIVVIYRHLFNKEIKNYILTVLGFK